MYIYASRGWMCNRVTLCCPQATTPVPSSWAHVEVLASATQTASMPAMPPPPAMSMQHRSTARSETAAAW